MGRAEILKSIKANKPEMVALPEIDTKQFSEEVDLLDTFKQHVQLVGGNLLELDNKDNLDVEIKKLYPKAEKIVSYLKDSNLGDSSITISTQSQALENVDLAILEGVFGVSENGSVWISEEQFPIRVLPFITNDLVIVLSKTALCENMHEAYKKLAYRDKSFGLFLSGPSKTADIEQCLVIGAQGAMSLTIVLV
ncbi:MAG: LUD domain-containing protein [Bacteroidetes bacterium]|nr:LUD domain-containing protein [Bacteroidota bacterium]